MPVLYAPILERAGFIAPQVSSAINGPQTLIAFGDSFTHNGASYRGDDGAYTTKTVGYWVWINMLSKSDFKVLDHAGVSGSKVSDLIARIDDVLLSGASVVVVLAGVNDITADVAVSEVATNMLNLVNQITNNNQYVILCPVSHRNGDYNTNIDLLNAEYQTIAAGNDKCFMVGVYDEFNSYIDSGNGSAVTSDGLHPNTEGAYLIGKNIAATVDAKFNASIENLNNIIANPTFSGVGGRVVYGATGTMPDSWRLEYADPTDAGEGSGVGVGAEISGESILFKTGEVSPTDRARLLCDAVSVEQDSEYVFDALITIKNPSNITTFTLILKTSSGDVGKASFQYQPPFGSTTSQQLRMSTPKINVGNSATVEPIIQGYGTGLEWELTDVRLYKVT